MWISSKKWKAFEKRIADLERETQSQRGVLAKHLSDHEQENKDLHNILKNIKKEFYRGIAQTL